MYRRVRWTHNEGLSVYDCPNASSTQGKELSRLASSTIENVRRVECVWLARGQLNNRKCPSHSPRMGECILLAQVQLNNRKC